MISDGSQLQIGHQKQILSMLSPQVQTFVNSHKEEQTNDLATIDSKEGNLGKNTESLGHSERSLMSSRRADERRYTKD